MSGDWVDATPEELDRLSAEPDVERRDAFGMSGLYRGGEMIAFAHVHHERGLACAVKVGLVPK